MGENSKAWMGAVALLAVAAVQAVMVELPLSPTQMGWARVILAVLMVGGGTYGIWKVPNRPLDAPPVDKPTGVGGWPTN